MLIRAHSENALHELARVMTVSGCHSTATALRMLSYEGYATLEEVDNASDWALLSIRGIGERRLSAVRRLTKADWQPPSPQTIHAANWFLSAARFALRYWSPQTLTALIQGHEPVEVMDGSVERQVAIDVLSDAVRKALRHREQDELVQALWQVSHSQGRGVHHPIESTPRVSMQTGACSNEQCLTPEPECSRPELHSRAAMNSERFAYSHDRRREIVERYRAARDRGEITNKDSWARSHFSISAKTLVRYEREFPETDAKT